MAGSNEESGSVFPGLTPGLTGAAVDPRLMDPEFHMEHGAVRTLGDDMAGRGQNLSELRDTLKGIDLAPYTFGLIGGGLNGAHGSVRDTAADALTSGKDVLESWKKALQDVADNSEDAELASTAPEDPLEEFPGGGGTIPGFDPSALGGTDPNLPDPNLPDPNLPDPNVPDPNAPDPNVPDPNVPDPNAPDPNVPDPNVPDPNAPNPNAPNTSGLNPDDPTGTRLAATDPNALRQPVIPDLRTPTPDSVPVDQRNVGPGVRNGLGGSSSTGGVGPGAASGLGNAARGLGTAASGMPMMPFAPMMGGSGNQDGQDRDRGAALNEDESTWLGDEEVAPPVIGMEEE
ncbi:hypothetical protein [Streptosporangium sp. KLBMP 9127]|nr:hypothetical protein [Streptosporangium sp. KLBMP 9127]